MVSESIRSKKTLVLYKAYKMENGDTMTINPREDAFYLTEKNAVAALIESMVDTTKENPLEKVEAMKGETVQILRIAIFTNKIPTEDWKKISQEGDEIRLPIGKYQKSMNINSAVVDGFEVKPNRTDNTKIDVSKVVFRK